MYSLYSIIVPDWACMHVVELESSQSDIDENEHAGGGAESVG